MSKPIALLMSGDNPEGWKLEDLCDAAIRDLEVKCAKLTSDDRPEAQDVLRNNRECIARFREIKRFQIHTLKRLDAIGKDQGPTGKPRVGAGS